jgi:hypothetical protein
VPKVFAENGGRKLPGQYGYDVGFISSMCCCFSSYFGGNYALMKKRNEINCFIIPNFDVGGF